VIGQLNEYLQDMIGQGLPIYRIRLAYSTENIRLTAANRILLIGGVRPITSSRFKIGKRVDAIGQFAR